MKRELLALNGESGFQTYPSDSFKNNRSKRARSRDIKIEHQHARSIRKRHTRDAVVTAPEEAYVMVM